MEFLEVPFSMPVAAVPFALSSAPEAYNFARGLEYGTTDPPFNTGTREHEHLSVGIQLLSSLVTRTVNIPSGALLICEVYEDAAIGMNAMTSGLLSILNEEAFSQVIELPNLDPLLRVIAHPRLGTYSPDLAYAEVQIWPMLDGTPQTYVDTMGQLIPGDPPAGLAVHLAYFDDDQVIVINVWHDEHVAMTFHDEEFMPRWNEQTSLLGLTANVELVPAACLGVAVDQFLNYTADLAE
ncbi:MAG: hypothetical protein K0S68_399 [Candidatus Saccharibacteria bacterium]|jgi:hypothetical protein|nr:hypothetical protein [Candidatus Saccharibacteria bacterium]